MPTCERTLQSNLGGDTQNKGEAGSIYNLYNSRFIDYKNKNIVFILRC